jgi:2-phospho-L-lactate guanylyltransferase (CobY/MobA/RfbA family)
MKVELLKSAGCAHSVEAEALLRDVLGALAPEATLAITVIETAEQAAATRFAGSPTILLDGIDLEPDAIPIAGLG